LRGEQDTELDRFRGLTHVALLASCGAAVSSGLRPALRSSRYFCSAERTLGTPSTDEVRRF